MIWSVSYVMINKLSHLHHQHSADTVSSILISWSFGNCCAQFSCRWQIKSILCYSWTCYSSWSIFWFCNWIDKALKFLRYLQFEMSSALENVQYWPPILVVDRSMCHGLSTLSSQVIIFWFKIEPFFSKTFIIIWVKNDDLRAESIFESKIID